MRTSSPAVAVAATFVLVGSASPVSAQQFVDETGPRFGTPLAEYSNQVAFCDVDGDGDLDIAFANGGGYNAAQPPQRQRLYINNGSGVFTEESAARLGSLTAIARDLEFGDVDNDGDWDIAIAQDFSRPALLLLNNGAGVFTDVSATHLPAIPMGSPHCSFGDVDSDGDLDLLFANGGVSRFGTARARLFINSGDGHFTDETEARTPNVTVSEPMDGNLVDLNGDRHLDIIVASRSNSTRLMFNDGTGHFTHDTVGNWPGDGITYSFDFGDFDKDGDLDILGVNSLSAEEGLYINDEFGSFTEESGSWLPQNPNLDDNDSKWFDYDSDGDLDFIVARLFGPERIYRQDEGEFTLTNNVIQQVTASALDVEVGDLDGDGDFDIVIAVGESGSFVNHIYINHGKEDTSHPDIVYMNDLFFEVITTGGPYVVNAVIRDDMTSDRNFYPLDLRLDVDVDLPNALGSNQFSVPVRWMGYDQYRAEIPAQPLAHAVYTLVVVDAAGNESKEFGSFTVEGSLADLNGDGFVNGADLAILLTQWGTDGAADFNGDNMVNGADLAILLTNWAP